MISSLLFRCLLVSGSNYPINSPSTRVLSQKSTEEVVVEVGWVVELAVMVGVVSLTHRQRGRTREGTEV